MCFYSYIAKYYGKDYIFEYIWFYNKIYTVKKIVKDNIYEYQVFNNITYDNSIQGLSANYYDLLSLTNFKGCKPGYKKCGILDTMENYLCIDIFYPCPINEIVVDRAALDFYFFSSGFKARENVNYITYNYKFYYTNYSTDGKAIIMLKKTYEQPKYIDYDNLQFDIDFMTKFFDETASDIENFAKSENSKMLIRRLISIDISEIVELVSNIFSIFEKISELINKYSESKKFDKFMDFVVKKIDNDENNYDNYFLPIGDNCYVKNYIGFKTIEDINKFVKLDFNIYKKIFPNQVSSRFAVFGFIVSILLIAISISLLILEEKNANIFLIISFIIHLIFFFRIYFLCRPYTIQCI